MSAEGIVPSLHCQHLHRSVNISVSCYIGIKAEGSSHMHPTSGTLELLLGLHPRKQSV